MVSAAVVVACTSARSSGLVEDLASRYQLRARGRHDVGQGRSVLEFDVAAGTEAEAASTVVRRLRAEGLAAIDGPWSSGHEVAWARRNAPTYFGPGACVCFPWSVFDRDVLDLVIEIDPGRGFGAGGHPTTLLLLERLL